jgi:hypothetical protein
MKRRVLSPVLMIVLAALLTAGVSRGSEWLSTLQQADTPPLCQDQGKNCGEIDDGHGGKVNCGTCTPPDTCEGSGIPNVCGCTPQTCAGHCGEFDPGCGRAKLSCGGCTGTDICGGGGTANVCGCTPKTCAGLNCGTITPGCGLLPLSCGQCGSPTEICNNNVCCTPKGCGQQNCGSIEPGCGRPKLNCGQCTSPAFCRDNFSCCTPRVCGSRRCGSIEPGCGLGTVSCGSCPIGLFCDATGSCRSAGGGGGGHCLCGHRICQICAAMEQQVLSSFDGTQEKRATTRSLRLLNLRRDFSRQWIHFSKPADPGTGNVFELTLERPLFPQLSQEKTLRITAIALFARCTGPTTYTVDLTTPSTTDKLTLSPVPKSGGLHRAQRDAVDLELTPTGPPALWKLKMSRSGGVNLQAGEVKDIFLVLEYETE